MNKSIIELLRCPVCGAEGGVSEDQKSFRCHGPRTHCFDFSKSGYLNLAGPHAGAGDLKAAVRARTLFLEGGYYEPLSDEINHLLDTLNAKTILDAGCGEGYYSNRVAEGRVLLGVDLSSAGIDHAAKTAKRTENGAGYVVASLFTLPVGDRCFDAVLNLFAPCSEEEFCRVLKEDGYMIIVAAGERHLFGLKSVLYDNPYSNSGRADLPQNAELVSKHNLHYEITVEGQAQIEALFSMTPYYWRTSERDKAKLTELQSLRTEVDFDIFVYKRGPI